jgi:DNA-binding CsgD family transcriptional regulator
VDEKGDRPDRGATEGAPGNVRGARAVRALVMSADERRIHELGEAIDRAALDPAQWPGVVDAICGSLPGTKAVIFVADTHDHGAIDIVQHGFDAGLLAEYEQHYARLNPWTPFLGKSPTLQALISDETLPAWTFSETEFYRDWLVRVGDVESAAGIKIVHEPDRMGVLAIHYAPSLGPSYNHRSAHLLQRSAVRLRRAVDVARLAQHKRAAGGSAAVQLGAFAVPALLLDGRGRVVELNDAAKQLIGGSTLSLGFNNMLRLADAALSERVAAVARQIAAGWGPWSQGLDVPLIAADGRRTLSLVAVCEPPIAGMPAFFAPARLTLLLVRPAAGGDVVGPAPLDRQFGLTPAERRLAVEVASGVSLRESADRLGIAYHTARTQLKAVFGKTGVSRQAELVALLARLSAAGRPGRLS